MILFRVALADVSQIYVRTESTRCDSNELFPIVSRLARDPEFAKIESSFALALTRDGAYNLAEIWFLSRFEPQKTIFYLAWNLGLDGI